MLHVAILNARPASRKRVLARDFLCWTTSWDGIRTKYTNSYLRQFFYAYQCIKWRISRFGPHTSTALMHQNQQNSHIIVEKHWLQRPIPCTFVPTRAMVPIAYTLERMGRGGSPPGPREYEWNREVCAGRRDRIDLNRIPPPPGRFPLHAPTISPPPFPGGLIMRQI